ncbi:MAG: trypsin-like serine protease, partial [Bdellovibrionales bacterium]
LGCGDSENNGRHDGALTADLAVWSPDSVNVRCPSKDCPEGIGAVVFAQATGGGFRLQRCTATLITPEKILTNSHCGKSLRYDRAYFFVRKNGQTVRYALASRIFDREEGAGIEAGMGPDLAIFTLSDTVTGIKPRNLGRKIPSDIKELTGFKINEPGRSLFQNFTLEKDKCTTIPKQALFGGGSEERNIGLALFGCTIVRGNSGSPLFANGNWDDIQVVVNSSYPFQSQSGMPFLSKLESLFEVRPVYFSENFAMGNRVHCMEIEGFAAPEALCTRASIDTQIRRSFESSTVKIYQERLNELNADPSAIWGIRVFDVKVRKTSFDPNPKPGIVMIPYPICMRSNSTRGDLGPQQVQYMALAMDAAGGVSGHLRKSQTIRARFFKLASNDEYQVSFDRDFRSDFSYDMPGTSVAEPEDSEARKYLAQTALQINRCKDTDHAQVIDGDVTNAQDFFNR